MSRLSRVTTQRVSKPWSMLVYGPAGIGKSTFGSKTPSPIFITSEDGLSEIIDENGCIPPHFPKPESFGAVLECIDELHNEQHNYKTVVIDTVDWLEPMIWDEMFRTRKTDSGKSASSIEDYGYGKGYKYALDEWRRLAKRLELLANDRNMNLVLLGHSQVGAFNNPEGVNFDRYTLKIHRAAGDFLREWVKACLFVNYEIFSHKASGEIKAKGVGSGARVMHTEQRPAFDAKNRYALPPEMPFDFGELSRYLSGEMSQHRAAELVKQLRELVAETELAAATEQWLTIGVNSKNVTELQALIDRASSKLGKG